MTQSPVTASATSIVCRVSQRPQGVQVIHLGARGLTETARETPPPPVDPARQQADERLNLLLDDLIAVMEEFELRRSQSVSELQQLAVELAVAVASSVTEAVIDRQQHGIDELVQTAIMRMGLDSPLEVALHPRDLELIRQRQTERNQTWPEGVVRFTAADDLEPGSLRVMRDGTGLLSRVQSRLSDLRRHLIEGLDDAQIERRHASGADSLLRRFPNRRNSA